MKVGDNMYGYTLVVDGFDLDDSEQNAALEYLPYDIVAGRSGGVITLDVECDSISASDSVMRSYEDLNKIGVRIQRIDLDLVGLTDVAERISSSRETVRLWSTGARRSNFPAHYTSVGASRFWAWSDIFVWLRTNSIIVDELYSFEPLPTDVIEAFNGAFAQNRDRSSEGWLRTAKPSAALPFARATTLVTRTGWKSLA